MAEVSHSLHWLCCNNLAEVSDSFLFCSRNVTPAVGDFIHGAFLFTLVMSQQSGLVHIGDVATIWAESNI